MTEKTLSFVATCTPGLEKICLKELEKKFGIKARVLHMGRLKFDAEKERIPELNYRTKTLHRIILLLAEGEAFTLDEIYKIAKDIDYTEFILPTQSFAVKTKRFGEHAFTSMEISAVIGQAVIDSYQQSTGKRLKVNLSNPDIRILAELYENKLWIGIDTTGDSLHKRWYRKHTFITSLRSTIAHAMVMLSELSESSSFLDPMCGTGMIPIEAFHYLAETPNLKRTFAFERFPWLSKEIFEKVKQKFLQKNLDAKIFGSDINKKVVLLAKENAREAFAKVYFFIADACKTPIKAEIICTDLPYGIRLRKINLKKLYAKFFTNLEKSEACRKVVIITAEKSFRLIPKLKMFNLAKVLRIIYGDLNAKIAVLERV